MRNLFFDEIQRSKTKFPELEPFFDNPDEIKLFEVSNVSEIVNQRFRSKGELRFMSHQEVIKSTPNIAPQFPRMWFEFSFVQKVDRQESKSAYEKLINKKKISKEQAEFAINHGTSRFLNGKDILAKEGMYFESEKTTNGWNIRGIGITVLQETRTLSKVRSLSYFVQTSAAVDGTPSGKHTIKVNNGSNLSALYLSGSLHKFLYAISLMHCKNIIIEEVAGKSTHIRNRRHRDKGTRHHVLKIIPMKKVKAYQEKGASALSKGDVSLHIRRGHFKTYSPEAPLFGVHSGTFWWESHTAGKAEAGTVTKDYQINAPGE